MTAPPPPGRCARPGRCVVGGCGRRCSRWRRVAGAVGLGVYGRTHEPTFFAINLAGFSSGTAAKAWLATGAFVLAVVQLVSALVHVRPDAGPGAVVDRWAAPLVRAGRRAARRCRSPCTACTRSASSRLAAGAGALAGRLLVLRRVHRQDARAARRHPGWALPVLGGAVFTALTALWLTSSVWFFTTSGLTF